MIELAYKLFPGFGVFGPSPHFAKGHDVNARMCRLEIFLDIPNERHFVFPNLRFIDAKGKVIAPETIVKAVEISSRDKIMPKGDLTKRFILGHRMVSGIETRPRLTVIFKSPISLAKIRVINRPGPMGRIARHLALRGYFDQNLVFAARNSDPQAMLEAFESLCQKLGVSYEPAQAGQDAAFIAQVHQAVLEDLEKIPSSLNARNLLDLLPLLDHKGPISVFEMRLMVEIIIRALGKNLSCPTVAIEPLSALLNAPARLEAVMVEVNRRLSQRLGRKVVVMPSKHVIQEPKLVLRRDQYLDALDEVFPVLRACGVTPMLCYGSLLGAVREGKFLAHDDDVDLLYHDGSTSREEMLKNRHKLQVALEKLGYKSDLSDRIVNFHISKNNVSLDLFPCWEDQEGLHAMMRYPTYQPIAKAIILPVSEVALHGRSYPAPQDPAAFLKARYGSGWRVSDPYYEWPWPIKPAPVRTGVKAAVETSSSWFTRLKKRLKRA